MTMAWWESFFDDEYVRIWGGSATPEKNEEDARGLWEILGLAPGSRVLDAPCGYGRLSRLLALRGALVLGVDQSETVLSHAERTRAGIDATKLRYRRHDLRQPFDESGFDAAINVFSSLGYGTEADDLAILSTLRDAVRPGGLVFIDTAHRDLVAAMQVRGVRPADRLADGTLVIEQPRFDPIAGRVETCWYWWGPHGNGQKPASMRIYSITELVRMMERVGLGLRSAHRGCKAEPFEGQGADLGGRIGLVGVRG
jgi:SAM-dependent methyltransferase